VVAAAGSAAVAVVAMPGVAAVCGEQLAEEVA